MTALYVVSVCIPCRGLDCAHGSSRAKLCLGGKDVGQLSFLLVALVSQLIDILWSRKPDRFTYAFVSYKGAIVSADVSVSSPRDVAPRFSPRGIGAGHKTKECRDKERFLPHWEPRITVIVIVANNWA